MAWGEAPLTDGVVGGESLSGDGVVRGDGHGQDAGVGDDTAWGRLATVPTNVGAHCEGETEGGEEKIDCRQFYSLQKPDTQKKP